MGWEGGRSYLIVACQVGLEGLSLDAEALQFRDQLLCGLGGRVVVHGDVTAQPRERKARSLADSTSAARDERELVGQLHGFERQSHV